IIGRGANKGVDGGLIAEAGWDTECVLEGAVVIKFTQTLKNVRIQAELRGYVETRFEAGSMRLATRAENNQYKISSMRQIFQNIVEVVYDSKHPLIPNPSGAPVSLPFLFKLPKNKMPASFNSYGGVIEYYIKCTLLYNEGIIQLIRSTQEVEVPVIITMPKVAIYKLLNRSSAYSLEGNGSDGKIQYSIHLPKRIVTIGDEVEVQITILSTPGNFKLRMMNAALRPVISYLNENNIAVQARFPRPLSEMSQPWSPQVKIGGSNGIDPIVRRIYLRVDPELAQASLESSLISIKTILRVELILDSSETPNISEEVPLVILPKLPERYEPLAVAHLAVAGAIASPRLSEHRPSNASDADSFFNVLRATPTMMAGKLPSLPSPIQPTSPSPQNAPTTIFVGGNPEPRMPIYTFPLPSQTSSSPLSQSGRFPTPISITTSNNNRGFNGNVRQIGETSSYANLQRSLSAATNNTEFSFQDPKLERNPSSRYAPLEQPQNFPSVSTPLQFPSAQRQSLSASPNLPPPHSQTQQQQQQQLTALEEKQHLALQEQKLAIEQQKLSQVQQQQFSVGPPIQLLSPPKSTPMQQVNSDDGSFISYRADENYYKESFGNLQRVDGDPAIRIEGMHLSNQNNGATQNLFVPNIEGNGSDGIENENEINDGGSISRAQVVETWTVETVANWVKQLGATEETVNSFLG
ncbi:hypothetical protein HK100_005539, partial [Physocladia obscura]